MTRIIIILLLLAVRIIFGCPEWLASEQTPYLLKMISYNVFHASWLHLVVNGLAVWSIFDPKRKGFFRELTIAFIISLLVYPVSFRPVVGISNLLYAVLGLRTPSLSSSWWGQTPVLIFLAVTIAMTFVPQISALTHILSFIAGILIACLRRGVKSLDTDIDGCLR